VSAPLFEEEVTALRDLVRSDSQYRFMVRAILNKIYRQAYQRALRDVRRHIEDLTEDPE